MTSNFGDDESSGGYRIRLPPFVNNLQRLLWLAQCRKGQTVAGWTVKGGGAWLFGEDELPIAGDPKPVLVFGVQYD